MALLTEALTTLAQAKTSVDALVVSHQTPDAQDVADAAVVNAGLKDIIETANNAVAGK